MILLAVTGYANTASADVKQPGITLSENVSDTTRSITSLMRNRVRFIDVYCPDNEKSCVDDFNKINSEIQNIISECRRDIRKCEAM